MARIFVHTKLLQENKALIAEVKSQAGIIKKNKAAINALAKLIPADDFFVSGSTICASLRVRDLDSFKEKKLVRVLEKIEAIVGGEFTSEMFPEFSNCDYRLRNGNFSVSVYAFLKDSPKGCRKVLVDVKCDVVERKIYKIECL